jgi:hypothetical protein
MTGWSNAQLHGARNMENRFTHFGKKKIMKRIKHNDLLPWFTQDHGQLPKAYIKSCEKFFRELGIKAASNELQAASFKQQAASSKLDKSK